MPAAGTSTSSSRIVVSGSLRWPALGWRRPGRGRALRSRRSRSRSRSRPRRRRLRLLRLPSSSSRLAVALVLVCWSWFWLRPPWLSRFCSRFVPVAVLLAAVPVLVAGSAASRGCRPGCRGCGSRGPARPVARGPGVAVVAALVVPVAVLAAVAALAVVALARSCRRSCRPASDERCSRLRAALVFSACRAGWRLGLSAGPRRVFWVVWLCSLFSLAGRWPPWAALIASTSCAFFMEPAPLMPMPPAIALRSASSMELSPPPRFFAGAADASGAAVVDSMVSVT